MNNINKKLRSIATTICVGTYAYINVSSTNKNQYQYHHNNHHHHRNHLLSYCDNKTSDNSYNDRSLHRNFIADAAEIVSPAVVNILCAVDSNNNIFGVTGASSGSGFIISKDGFIVTNAHVIDKTSSNKVLVTMWNSKKRYGVIHSFDRTSDIALIKLIDVESDEDLPIAKLGINNRPRVGEFVVALGSPLHLANSVTFGIISSTARHASELGMVKNRNEFIQTDAAINEGNSGGPLVNLDGEVIGINSMKIQGSSGISFAIPIDTAYQIIRQLQTNKKVIRPYLGMKMANYILNQSGGQRLPNKQKQQNILSTENVFVIVVDVEKGSPSEKAGFQNGDIILEVDGQQTNGMRSIYDAIGLQIGKSITFLVQRNNKYDPITITVKTEGEKKS